MKLQTFAYTAIIIPTTQSSTAVVNANLRGANIDIDNNDAPRIIEGEDDELIRTRDPHRELMTRQYRMFKEGVISDSSEDTVANNHVGTIDLSLSSVEEEEGNLFSEQKVNQLKKDPRIIGGTNAGSSEFPFSVSMQDNIGHFCGGSLITPNMVLTAA